MTLEWSLGLYYKTFYMEKIVMSYDLDCRKYASNMQYVVSCLWFLFNVKI